MSEQPSMINRSASERAEKLRNDLRGFRDVDALLADANRLKREAALEAEHLVAEAQALADDVLGEAQSRASTIVSEASSAAEETQARLDSVLSGIESSVRELGGHLEGALRSVTALARSIEEVRTGHEPADSGPGGPTSEIVTVGPVEQAEQVESPDGAGEQTVEHLYENDPRSDDAGARPLGWLFRATTQG